MRRASQTKQLRCGCCCFTWINLSVSAVWGEKKPDMRLIYYVSQCAHYLTLQVDVFLCTVWMSLC